nr:hypothetical protein [Escherichia coli]
MPTIILCKRANPVLGVKAILVSVITGRIQTRSHTVGQSGASQ